MQWKRGFEAIKNSRNSQFTVSSVYNVNTRATREITLELPDGMRSTAEDLVGNEAAALYAVAVPEFVSQHCPQLMPNWSRVSELLAKFQISGDAIKVHPKYTSQMDIWKAQVSSGGATALCEDLIRSTYQWAVTY